MNAGRLRRPTISMAAGLFSEQIVPRLCLGEDMLPGQRNAAGRSGSPDLGRAQ
jgi:hypothetical protein